MALKRKTKSTKSIAEAALAKAHEVEARHEETRKIVLQHSSVIDQLRRVAAADRRMAKKHHEENLARLDGIERGVRQTDMNQRVLIDLTQELLSIEHQNRRLDLDTPTPVLTQMAPHSEETVVVVAAKSTDTIPGH